jgi:hypothetical protein
LIFFSDVGPIRPPTLLRLLQHPRQEFRAVQAGHAQIMHLELDATADRKPSRGSRRLIAQWRRMAPRPGTLRSMSMTNSRLITPSAACALGAAMLVTTALQSMPAEALSRGAKAGSQKVASGQISARQSQLAGKQTKGTIAKPTRAPIPAATGQFNPVNFPGGGSQGAVGAVKPTRPLIPPVAGQIIPGPVNFPGSVNRPPVIVAGPINPGNYPGGVNRPPVIGTTPTHGPVPPVTGPINPGTYPGGGNRPPVIIAGPINPGNYPGGGTPPISTVPVPIPTPIPIPIPTGSGPSPNPGHGIGTSYTHGHGQLGTYADIGAGGGDYAPCRLFKSNYDRTGNAYWLKRYRVCLWQH